MLCSDPQYITFIDGNEITLWKYDIGSIEAIDQRIAYRKFWLQRIPLETLEKGKCL